MPFVIESSDIPQIFSDERRYYNFLLDAYPASTNTRQRFLDARLTVDGVVIPMASSSYEEDDNNEGVARLNATLARLSDRSAFTRTASIKFELGEKLSGVWTWKTKFQSGRVQGLSTDLANNGDSPNDKVSIVATTLLQSRLEKCPLGTVALYDPAKLTLSEADFISIPDIDGVDHLVTLVPIADLSIWSILDYLTNVVGFAGKITNIPDFPIRRIDFNPGEPYWNPVAGIIGAFKTQLDIDVDDNLVLKEGTNDLLADSVAAVPLTVDRLTALQDSAEIDRFKGTKVTYQEQGLGWDYWIDDVDRAERDRPTGLSTRRETYIRNYYRKSFPNTPVKSQKVIEHKWAYNGPLGVSTGLIAASGQSLTYTDLGLLAGSEKRVFSNSKAPQSFATFCEGLPTPGFDTRFIGPEIDFTSASDATFVKSTVVIRTEREAIEYAGHPYEPEQVYIRQRETENRGLIMRDNDNPQLDDPFDQSLIVSQRAGNLASGQASYWDQIGLRGEIQTPKRNHGVDIDTYGTDDLNADGEALLPEDYTDPRQGDIGISVIQHIQKEVYVFDEADPDANVIKFLNIGEVPISIGKPLAVRYNRAQFYPGNASIPIAGFDLSLTRGRTVEPKNRQGVSFGTYRITGFTISGGGGKFSTTLRGHQIGSADVVASESAQINDVIALALESTQNKIVTIRVQCFDGQFLSGEVVSDATVEARIGHSGPYTDIESDSIDLSSYDGTTQEVEVKVTLPTVTSHYVRAFRLSTGPEIIAPTFNQIYSDTAQAVKNDTEDFVYG